GLELPPGFRRRQGPLDSCAGAGTTGTGALSASAFTASALTAFVQCSQPGQGAAHGHVAPPVEGRNSRMFQALGAVYEVGFPDLVEAKNVFHLENGQRPALGIGQGGPAVQGQPG